MRRLLRVLAIGAAAALCLAASPGRTHEVKSGESLWSIARETVGDASLWPALYRANRDQIKDPAVLYPGQELAIPDLDAAEREAVLREAEEARRK